MPALLCKTPVHQVGPGREGGGREGRIHLIQREELPRWAARRPKDCQDQPAWDKVWAAYKGICPWDLTCSLPLFYFCVLTFKMAPVSSEGAQGLSLACMSVPWLPGCMGKVDCKTWAALFPSLCPPPPANVLYGPTFSRTALTLGQKSWIGNPVSKSEYLVEIRTTRF